MKETTTDFASIARRDAGGTTSKHRSSFRHILLQRSDMVSATSADAGVVGPFDELPAIAISGVPDGADLAKEVPVTVTNRESFKSGNKVAG